MKVVLHLMFLIIAFGLAPAFAQEECECNDLETFYIINDPEKINLINNNTCEQSVVYLALPKEKETKNLKILIQENESSFFVEFKSKLKNFSGQFYKHNDFMYGGSIKLGEKVRINGDVGVDKIAGIMDIKHNQEFSIYKFNLKRFTLEPTIHQLAQFHNNSNADNLSTFLQPASFGVFVRKMKKDGREFKAGVSAGPSVNFSTSTQGNEFQFKGQVNLRLSIPL